LHDFSIKDGEVDEDIERVFVVRSSDRGQSWGKPIRVAAGARCRPLGIRPSDRTTTVRGSSRGSIADVRVSRSTDDGRTWSAPATIASDVTCHECGQSAALRGHPSRRRRRRRVGRGLRIGVLLALRRTATTATCLLFARTTTAATWSAPQPIDEFADRDGDARTSIRRSLRMTGRGDGVAAWISHRPIGEGRQPRCGRQCWRRRQWGAVSGTGRFR
jgi:hypothetical protein